MKNWPLVAFAALVAIGLGAASDPHVAIDIATAAGHEVGYIWDGVFYFFQHLPGWIVGIFL